MIKVYSKPDCKYCEMLKHWLDKHRVAYQEVDISQEGEVRDSFLAEGHKTVPVLKVSGEVVSHEPYDNLYKVFGEECVEIKVKKRGGELQEFNSNKIRDAVLAANNETFEMGYTDAIDVLLETIKQLKNLPEGTISVETIQDNVEESLMELGYKQTAKTYILYREKKAQERKPDIFKERVHFKPYEYPNLEAYVDAIQQSYWLHTEYNYTSDIQDYKVNVTEAEREAIKRSMLAISQVEVTVKSFWGNLHNRLPKPELNSVGAVFAESEVRHSRAYAHLLEILGLNNEFEGIYDHPALIKRVNYLTKHNEYAKSSSNRDFTIAIAMFSMFIEHVSLFSQFLIIMSFNKYKNLFSGMSNVIEATSKEEQLHGEFGTDLVNTIRAENPDWFDEDMENGIIGAAKEAHDSEMNLIDWIYELGDLDFMPKDTVKYFVKYRLNNSLESIGYERIFEDNEDAIEYTRWFDDEVISTKHVDFFAKRNVNYTKRSQSVSADDLF